MGSRGFIICLALLVCSGLVATVLWAQTPEQARKQAEEEQRRKDALMSADARERERIKRLDLLSKTWQQGKQKQFTATCKQLT